MISRSLLLSSAVLLAISCSDDPAANSGADAGGSGGAGSSGGAGGSAVADSGNTIPDVQIADSTGIADTGAVDDRSFSDSAADRGGPASDANVDVTSGEPSLADAPNGDANGDPAAPRFPRTGKYSITIPVGDAAAPDPADVYYPDPPDLHTASYSFPIVLLLQGAKVARNFYSGFLSTVASYGFIVVAPDHVSNNLGGPGLYAELSEIAYSLAQMKLESASATAPVRGVVDTARLALLGHSYGGASGISGMANLCFPPIPFCSFTRPPELVGGAFYGAGIAPLGPVDVGGLPILMVQGDKDGKNTPASAQTTFDALSKRPKAYVTVLGANHFGITDVDNPAGADPEVNMQTLDHASGVASIGRWTGVFFAAYLAKDQAALGALRTAAMRDPNIKINLME